LVIVATPIDLARAIKLDKPSVRVRYEVQEVGGPAITHMIQEFVHTHQTELAGAGR